MRVRNGWFEPCRRSKSPTGIGYKYRWIEDSKKRCRVMEGVYKKREAADLCNRWNLEGLPEEGTSGVAHTWAEACDLYMERDFAPRTRQVFRSSVGRLKRDLGGDTLLQGITERLVKGYLERRSKGQATAPDGSCYKTVGFRSIQGDWVQVRTILENARSAGWIEHSPLAACKGPKPPKGRGHIKPRADKHITMEEFDRLIRCADNLTLRLALEIIRSTGARKSEAMQIQGRDIDLGEHPAITFRHDPARGQRIKNSETVVQPITSHLVAALRAWGLPKGSEWLFPGKRADKPATWPKLPFLRAVELADLPSWVTAHPLRRSVACQLIRKGAHAVQVSRFMRHTGLDVTELYVDVRRGDLETITVHLEPTGHQSGHQSAELAATIEARVNELRSLTSEYDRTCRLERETGLEPATLSLGTKNVINSLDLDSPVQTSEDVESQAVTDRSA